MTELIATPTDPATIFAWCAARFDGTRAAALFALDRQLGEIIRTTTQPIVGQMRLTWWHEALGKLGAAPTPAHPVLEAIAAAGLPGGELAAMVDGWEFLLDEELTDAALGEYARQRGGTLFALIDPDAPPAAGSGWALADLAAHVGDVALANRARALSLATLDPVLTRRWRDSRVLGALARDAWLAMQGRGTAASPRRAAAVLRMRLTGR